MIFPSPTRRGGMLIRIRGWFAPARGRKAGEFTALEQFNDHLLRDMGIGPYPSRQKRSLLMRL